MILSSFTPIILNGRDGAYRIHRLWCEAMRSLGLLRTSFRDITRRTLTLSWDYVISRVVLAIPIVMNKHPDRDIAKTGFEEEIIAQSI